MSIRCTMQKAFWVKSKCGFLYVFCMFFDVFRSSMLNQLSNFAPLCRFRRCAPCHLGSQPSNDPPEGSEVKATGVQPKGSSTFCSVTRLQWFTLITRSYTNRKQTGSDCPLGSFPTDMCKKVMKMKKNSQTCGTMWNSGSSQTQKKNLSSKHCNCSKAQPRWPILRPDCELSDPPRPYHQVPASPPQPLAWQANKPKLQCPQCPGKKPLENGRKKHRGHFFFSLQICLNTLTSMSQKNHWPRDRCAMTGVERLLPCEQRQAFGKAQRSSHAAKLEALQRKALEVSQRLQGLELCETHLGTLAAFPGGPHMAHPNIYTSTFHTSSILIHPHHHPHPYPISSSVLRPPSSVIHPRSIMHPSFIIHHACSQIKNAKRHPSARLEHHAADETSNPPNAGH